MRRASLVLVGNLRRGGMVTLDCANETVTAARVIHHIASIRQSVTQRFA